MVPHCHDGRVELSTLGPFFAVADRADGAEWQSLRTLLNGAVLDERVDHVATVLGRLADAEIEPRVAASTMSLGLFARLVAPVLGARTLGQPLPAVGLDETCWQPTATGPWPLALSGALTLPEPADTLTDVVLPLAAAIGERFALSGQVLLGNAASGVFGAVRMIGAVRPDLAGSAIRLGRELLSGPLQGTGVLADDFVRSSCCLYYRVPGGGYCGDCVLADH